MFRFLSLFLLISLLLAPKKPTPAPGKSAAQVTSTPTLAPASPTPIPTFTQPAPVLEQPQSTETPAPTRTSIAMPESTEIVQITLEGTFSAPATTQRATVPNRTPLVAGIIFAVVLVAGIIYTVMRRGSP